jgi:hypothetical protein
MSVLDTDSVVIQKQMTTPGFEPTTKADLHAG